MTAESDDEVGSGPSRDRSAPSRSWWSPLRRIPPAWRRALVAGLALRIGVAIVGLLAVWLIPSLDPPSVDPVPGTDFGGWDAPHPTEQGWGILGAGLERYDALWYLAIAEHGYPSVDAGAAVPEAYAFFPLLPLLIGVTGRLLLGRWLLAANLIALVAVVAALAAVHRLVEVETGDRAAAGRALVGVAVFPSAYFLVAPYTEAPFLALSGWALVEARRGRWLRAGGLSALAALSRPVGILLVVALALEIVRQHREGRRPDTVGSAVAVLGAPVGIGAFLVWAWLATGRPLAPLLAQEGWRREWMLPHETLRAAVETAATVWGTLPLGGYHGLDLLLLVPVVAAVGWLLARTPATYGVYALAHLVVWLVHPFPGRPLMSTYRFALGIAPLGWAFASWTRRGGARVAWWVVSVALLGAMTALFVTAHYVF